MGRMGNERVESAHAVPYPCLQQVADKGEEGTSSGYALVVSGRVVGISRKLKRQLTTGEGRNEATHE